MRRTFRRLTAATAVAVALTQAATAAAQAWPSLSHEAGSSVASAFDPSIVRQISLTMLPTDWDKIRKDRNFTIQVPATISIGGVTLPSQVLVRRKSGIGIPSTRNPLKVALKVDLNAIDGTQTWLGLTKLSLEASSNSAVSEGIALLLHQSASIAAGYGVGYDAALANWVNVSVNGSNLGIYVSVEQRNKAFLKNRNLWWAHETWMYKQAGRGLIEVTEGDLSPLSPQVSTLCFAVFTIGVPKCANPPSDAALQSLLTANVDMQTLLTMAGINRFINNWDDMLGNFNNYYWVDWTRSGAPLRRYYPWDVDLSLRSGSNVQVSIFAAKWVPRSNVIPRQTADEALILNHPVFREQYRTILYSLMGPGKPLSQASLVAMVNEVEALLTPYLNADPYFRGQVVVTVADHFAWLRNWLSQRPAIVKAQLDANIPAPRP